MSNAEENKNTGFIKIYRSLKKHWLWKDAERLKWWIIILMEVNHSDKKTLIHGTLYDCMRGQSLNSLETWSKEFRCSIQQVRTFFKVLKEDGMIELEGMQKTTRLTVCNYDTYNKIQQTNNTQITDKQQTVNRQLTTNNNVKNDDNVKNDKKNKVVSEVNIPFEDAWNLYDKKVGNKSKLEKKWNTFTDDERTKAMEHIEKYKQQTPDKQYRKNLETYLNNKSFNDEIIVSNNNNLINHGSTQVNNSESKSEGNKHSAGANKLLQQHKNALAAFNC